MKNLKRRETLRISNPAEALDAIASVMLQLVVNPSNAEGLDGATLRPIEKVVEREGDIIETHFAFEVEHDGAGLPETEQILVEA